MRKPADGARAAHESHATITITTNTASERHSHVRNLRDALRGFATGERPGPTGRGIAQSQFVAQLEANS